MKTKVYIVLMIICFVCFIGFMSVVVAANNTDILNEDNTTEMTGTVEGTSADIYSEKNCIIHTEEYGDKISIQNILKIRDIAELPHIESGQVIRFRIENSTIEHIKDMKVIGVVSLEIDGKQFVSLSEYNEYIRNQCHSATIAGTVAGLLFLSTMVFFAVKMRQNILVQKSRSESDT